MIADNKIRLIPFAVEFVFAINIRDAGVVSRINILSQSRKRKAAGAGKVNRLIAVTKECCINGSY